MTGTGKRAFSIGDQAYSIENMATVHEIALRAAALYPDRAAYIQPGSASCLQPGVDREEIRVTFRELAKHVERAGNFLHDQYGTGLHYALIGATDYRLIAAYIAITAGVGVAVPMDKDLPDDVIIEQLEAADVDVVICTEKCLEKITRVLELRDVKCGKSEEHGRIISVIPADALVSEPSGGYTMHADPEANCTILFTSGTTGANKCVMLSNRNIIATLRGCRQLLLYPGTSYSVLPMNHAFELHAHLLSCIYLGTTVAINDDMRHFVKNLERFQPEMSCMVPMMLELLVKRIRAGIREAGGEKRFLRMVALSDALRHMGMDMRRKLFRSIRKKLGGNLKMIISGGAELKQETIDFLEKIGVYVYNGYGITECSPVVAVNPWGKARKHSVGRVLPRVRARIAAPDSNGNGEIQLYGDIVMMGYYRDEEATAEVFTEDGWFRTGDIGHLDKDNYLYVNGRIKDLIILSNGQNIFPQEIEKSLQKQIPYIEECIVSAHDSGSGLFARCYLNPEFCRKKGLADKISRRKYLQKDLERFNSLMPGERRIYDVEIAECEFTKSSTHKIRRITQNQRQASAGENSGFRRT